MGADVGVGAGVDVEGGGFVDVRVSVDAGVSVGVVTKHMAVTYRHLTL